jgi:hypothetical protein
LVEAWVTASLVESAAAEDAGAAVDPAALSVAVTAAEDVAAAAA